MRVTWKDAVTTISAGGAIVLERAYSQNFDWPLVSEIRWVIIGLAVLTAVNLVLGFAFDRFSSDTWDVFGILLGAGLAIVVTLGMFYAAPVYVLLLMLSAVAIWLISISHHFTESSTPHTLNRI
jgi:phosphatidylserine synthase